MAVTAWKTPNTCASVDRDGEKSWSDPDNAKISDDARTECFIAKSTYSDWLRCTNFGFGLGDVPAGATIDGIEVKVERRASLDNDIRDSALYLRDGVGRTGDNKASATFWTTSDVEVTYGGAADDWNAGLDDAEVRAASFGVDFSAHNVESSQRQAYVDCISIRVYYTAAAAGAAGAGSLAAAAAALLT